jgi:hypothetical protein
MNITLESRTGYASFRPSSSLAFAVRVLFRKLGLFHSFRHASKLITIDVPFQLTSTPDGRSLVILFEKACLPRRYPLERLLASCVTVEKNLGTSVVIRHTEKWIAFCLDVA